MSQENIALARSLYEAFNRGDADTVLGAFDENIEWYEAEGMPYGGLHRGPQAVAENVFGPVTNDFEGFSVTPDEAYADGDEVLMVVTYRGTAKESGKTLDNPAVHAWTVRDGKIARFRQFMDTVKYNEVLAVEAAV
jgi:ketosteroid isomerase-like protein